MWFVAFGMGLFLLSSAPILAAEQQPQPTDPMSSSRAPDSKPTTGHSTFDAPDKPAVAVPVDTMMALDKRRPNTKERNINLPSKVSGMPSKNQEDEMPGCRQVSGRKPNIHRHPVLSRVRPAVSRAKMLPKRERVVNSTIKR